ncbi:hypothetical protein ACFE04_002333 [Oxalis oulophora]
MGVTNEVSQFHVLAVDDSIIDRKWNVILSSLFGSYTLRVARMRFFRIGYDALTSVDSGTKALEFLGLTLNEELDEKKNSNSEDILEVNLIITDYCMPGMTGYDLLKRIKESAALKDIPVVIMSSENVPSRINRCLEEGAEEFFLKPVQLSDVNKLKPHVLKGLNKENQSNKRKVLEDIHSPDKARTKTTMDKGVALLGEAEELLE